MYFGTSRSVQTLREDIGLGGVVSHCTYSPDELRAQVSEAEVAISHHGSAKTPNANNIEYSGSWNALSMRY
jgi:hypothetical protein